MAYRTFFGCLLILCFKNSHGVTGNSNIHHATLKTANISDKQYDNKPELFVQDNYDNCMLRGDEFFYCQFSYHVEPIDPQNPTETWMIIKNLSEVETNYNHDELRRWICVPKTCPGINKTNEEDPELKKSLTQCIDKQMETWGLKGSIRKLKCFTNQSRYPWDWLDYFACLLFGSYVSLVLFATVYEGLARYGPKEEYERKMATPMGRILSAGSITRNWIRLKTINSTLEVEKLRSIQGMRVYNTALVILSHTILSSVFAPVMNTQYPEHMHLKAASLFFASGPLCVATNFFISAFLLSSSLFEHLKDKKMNLNMIAFVIVNRFIRLTPTVCAVVLFHATILRHMGSGPNWDQFVNTEYHNCRKNGWANVMFINNMVDYEHMCLPVTWYLALDTQYFIIGLFLIWFLKSYERFMGWIMGALVSTYLVAIFTQNYLHGFTALDFPTPEKYYGKDNMLTQKQFHYQLCSTIGNMAGLVVGTGFGYYFYKHKNDKVGFFTSKLRVAMWWILSFVLGFGFVIVPGLWVLDETVEHSPFWASVYVAVSRPLICFTIGTGIIGMSEGIGWLALRTLRWSPTYVLGRLSFGAYLLHMSVVLMRASLARSPLYISDFQIMMSFFGDITATYIFATIITLLLELPVSEMQKHIFGQQSKRKDAKEE